MRNRVLIVGLGVLLIQGLLPAQQPPVTAPRVAEPTPPRLAVRVIELKNYPARDLARILEELSGGGETSIIVDGDTNNRLIIRAMPDRIQEMMPLVQALDVSRVSEATQPLLCRVYMVEVPPKQSNLKPFTVVLRTASPVDSQQLLNAIEEGENLRIGRLLQGSEWALDDEPRILIRGVAASKAVIKGMIEAIPQNQISDLRWDDGTSVGTVAAAQITQLPEPLQQHIRKFLGNELQTVAYWFGNLSSPGEVEAPIGPWAFQLKARPAQGADLSIEVNVVQKPEHVMDIETAVLSNSIQGKVGRPIIIGYNRESYGARTMGAMIILLEADTAL